MLKKLTINDKLILWHLVFDQQISTINIATDLPNLKVVSVIDYHKWALTWNSIDTAVADFVEEWSLKLVILQKIKTKVCCHTSTYQIFVEKLKRKHVMTLTSILLTQLPLISYQSNQTNLWIWPTKIYSIALCRHLDSQYSSLMLVKCLNVGQKFPIVHM